MPTTITPSASPFSSRKRAKLNPPTRKEKRTIAMTDESGDDGKDRSNKTGKLKDPLDLSDSN